VRNTVKSDLDSVADEPDPDGLASEAVAHRGTSCRRSSPRLSRRPLAAPHRPCSGLPAREALDRRSILSSSSLRCRRAWVANDDTVVTNVQQPVCGFDRDRFSEVTPDVITVLEDADAPGLVDAPRNRLGPGRWGLFDRAVAVDDLKGCRSGQLEGSDRWHVTQGLMLPVVVVVDDPEIERGLTLLDRLEYLSEKNSLRMVLCKPSILPAVVGE
jgi:hypothetical protein